MRPIVLMCVASFIFSAHAKPIVYVDYHKDKIPNIVTAPGIASEIIFEEDETIEYATFGFDAAWESQIVLDHILIFKAKNPAPQTNLLVHTDKRSYIFTLTLGNKDWQTTPASSGAIYSMRMVYHDDKSIAAKTAQKQTSLSQRDISGQETYRFSNYDYRATANAQDLIPKRIWDNGSITFIAFKSGAKRGVVYELDHNNKSSLLNQHTEKNGLVVIHGVYSKMMIRLGDEAVELRRNTVGGTFENKNKTNVNGMMRMVAQDAPTAFKTAPSNPSLSFGHFQGEQSNQSSDASIIVIPEDPSERSED